MIAETINRKADAVERGENCHYFSVAVVFNGSTDGVHMTIDTAGVSVTLDMMIPIPLNIHIRKFIRLITLKFKHTACLLI